MKDMTVMKLNQNRTPPACIWEQAGVVPKKKCTVEFNCQDCKYHHALQKIATENRRLRARGIEPKGKRGRLVSWEEKLRLQPQSRRPCIHHMKNYIEFRLCHKHYHCIDCEFDQYFNDQFKVTTVLKPVDYTNISGIAMPLGYYFDKGHTWVKIEDKNTVKIGMSDFASRLFGCFDEISTPLIGKPLTRGKEVFLVSREGKKISFTAPVNGVVIGVNTRLSHHPELINQAPYTDGWVINAYCPDLKNDLKHLEFMDSAKSHMDHCVNTLYDILETESQIMAADGGELGNDIFGNVPSLSWERLVDTFIHPGP